MNQQKKFNDLCMYLHKKHNFKNVLVVKSFSTGSFLDNLNLDNAIINRFTYYVDRQKPKFIKNKNLLLKKTDHKYIEFKNLNNEIKKLNIKYDLICVDPYHEYKESYNDFFLLKDYLNDVGIMISHDCYPPNKKCTSPIYKNGEWCGITYAVFVELAYKNPNLYYAVLNTDYGLGIISKKEIECVKTNLDLTLQNQLVKKLKNNDEDIYDFFIANSKELINLIQL